MQKNGLDDNKTSVAFSTLLASAMERASRTARVERATRWGTRVLWGGGALVGALAWGLEQEAATAGRNAIIVLLSALCVGLGGALKRKSGTRERRLSALTAARRLEKRWARETGLLVAAVDFSEEEARDSLEKKETTSAVLRAATVESAERAFAEIAATLDETELFAVLTETPVDRFRKMGRTRWLCALGVLANGVVWGIARDWEERRSENRPVVRALDGESESATVQLAEDKENAKSKEKKKEGEDASRGEGGENKKVDGAENRAARETLSLESIELMISELAQNAEIAETLKAELENAVDEETPNAALFLQLARELNANLTRPANGLVAQTRRLSAAAERERRQIEASWAKINELDALTKNGEEGEVKGIGRTGKEVGESKGNARRISGKEIAVGGAAARWSELEKNLTSAGGVGDASTLELSRVLRTDSTAERKKILTRAAARVGEWGTMLRREETVARILSESWRFDAASRRRATLIKRAAEENRALLARFAGRGVGGFNASPANDAGLEEAKRRFNELWREIGAANQEGVAIVERLRERLQSETAQDFIEFVRRNAGAWKTLSLGEVEADEAAGRALDEMASQNEARWIKIAEDVENNRFGRAAERLETGVASPDFASESKNEGVLNVEIEYFAEMEDGERAEKLENDGSRSRRRFSALAALLTWGVGEKTFLESETQLPEKESVASLRNAGLTNNEAASQERKENEATSSDEGEEKDVGSAASAETPGKETKTSEINAEEIASWDASLSDDPRNGKNASGEELGSENGATAIGVWGGVETIGAAETTENKAFNAELPSEARRRLEGTDAPEILPEYAEKIRLYRRRISKGNR